MIKIENKGRTSSYVYDISLDGTVVNALGLNVMSNTDGFNFKLPSIFRYTEEHPYIGKGLNREVKKDKAYTGFEADVAEFNDLYMRDFHYSPLSNNKMGLGIDEIIASTINYSRKNYSDGFPDKPYPEDVKLVGNSIKSKKIEGYIRNFLDKAIRFLLRGDGASMLDEYYNLIERVYNYQIPLNDIVSKGKVKNHIADYLKDCKTLTKAGRPKSRQAWMELAIKEGLNPDIGETLYYVNTGNKKSDSDIKKVTHYYRIIDGVKSDIAATIDREYKKYKKDMEAQKREPLSKDFFIKQYFPDVIVKEEVLFNAYLIPSHIIESGENIYCEDGKEYNVAKYIEKLNNKVKPLLVCFSRDIREKILITNPTERPYFTKEETVLISGEPNKPGDQDTYEELMTMEDKEIRFWKSHPEFNIPFLKECGMDWDKIVSDYDNRQRREEELGIKHIREEYEKVISNLTVNEVNDFIEDGKIPSKLEHIVALDSESNHFYCKQFPDIIIGSTNDIIEQGESI